MKIGFRTGGFPTYGTVEILRQLKEIGYDGVELCFEHSDVRPEDMGEEQAQFIQHVADDLGIEIASLSYHADNLDPVRRDENIGRILRLAPSFRTKVFIINSRRTEPGRQTEQRREFERRLRELTHVAEGQGLRLAVEPEPGMFVEGTKEMKTLLETVASPALAVNLDVGHAFITDEDLCASVRELGPAIAHTHIEDIADRAHKHLVPGEGDIDFAALRAAFEDIGYQGYYTIDLFAIGDDPAGWARRGLSGLKRVFGLEG